MVRKTRFGVKSALLVSTTLPPPDRVVSGSMANTFYFMASPTELDVLDWFRSQADRPEEYPNVERTLLFYRQFGSLAQTPDGSPDQTMSPLISVYLPKVRRGVLWTIGEVHFLSKSKANFPALKRIEKDFRRWLGRYPVVWSREKDGEEGYGYFIEGTVKNVAAQIIGLPAGKAAFDAGQYFVAEHDNDYVLDQVCQSLRLRGVNCC